MVVAYIRYRLLGKMVTFWEAFSGKKSVCCRSIASIYVQPWQHINSVCACVCVCVPFMKPVMPEMATTRLYNALSREGCMCVWLLCTWFFFRCRRCCHGNSTSKHECLLKVLLVMRRDCPSQVGLVWLCVSLLFFQCFTE